MGGSSHKQFKATALWRIATPFDAGAIHPIRDGAAVAVLEEGGLISFLSGVLPLKVMALDGTQIPATARDWVSFGQYAPNADGAPRSFGSLRPYTYLGDDLPDGPELWDAAMALLSEAEMADVAAGRIQP